MSSFSAIRRKLILLVAVLLLIALAALVGYRLGVRQTTTSFPAEGSAEAGFARDMARHHAQAVQMATIIRDNSADPEMRILALDIMLTQQAQIGMMSAWLNSWGLSNASTAPAMAWMGMPITGTMPGMATQADLNQLSNLQGTEADGQFLRLMIPHHQAGVAMAEAVLERSQQPQVRTLAGAIVKAQQNEIDYMQGLLKAKGFLPVPEDGKIDQGQMSH